MLLRFCLYGFLKNQRYFEPFLMLVFLDRGMSFTAIGWLTAIQMLTTNLFEIPSGAIADLCGRRYSLVVAFVAYIASFAILATAETFMLLAIGMALFGFGDAFRSGTHKAMVFEWLRSEGRTDERTKVYGLTRSWSKLGSALSSLIAAAIVLMTGNFAVAIWLSIPCYVINALNLATYPKLVEGEQVTTERTSLRGFLQHLVASFRNREIWPLMLESMGWGGTFFAIKDYLQPVLRTLVSVMLAQRLLWVAQNDIESTAIVNGGVYFVLFLLSAVASRQAHEFVTRFGSLSRASAAIWSAFLVILIAMIGFGLSSAMIPLAICFVLLHVLQNIWRPILVSRFDSVADPAHGATVMSIEGQSQRFATMILAPCIGLAIDLFLG